MFNGATAASVGRNRPVPGVYGCSTNDRSRGDWRNAAPKNTAAVARREAAPPRTGETAVQRNIRTAGRAAVVKRPSNVAANDAKRQNYTEKKDYGKVPAYLKRIRQQLEEEKNTTPVQRKSVVDKRTAVNGAAKAADKKPLQPRPSCAVARSRATTNAPQPEEAIRRDPCRATTYKVSKLVNELENRIKRETDSAAPSTQRRPRHQRLGTSSMIDVELTKDQEVRRWLLTGHR